MDRELSADSLIEPTAAPTGRRGRRGRLGGGTLGGGSVNFGGSDAGDPSPGFGRRGRLGVLRSASIGSTSPTREVSHPRSPRPGKRVEPIERTALGEAAAGLLGEFTGGGANPVDQAATANQAWTAELQPDELEGLRQWLDDVDPVSFFAGDPTSKPLQLPGSAATGPGDSVAASASGADGTAEPPETAAVDAGPALEDGFAHKDVAALGLRPARDQRCTDVHDAEIRFIDPSPLGEVVCQKGERAWKKKRRETLATLTQNGGFGVNDQYELMEDGHFVGLHPSHRHHNTHNHEAIIARATRDPDSGALWLRADGELKHLPDPLVDQPLRLPNTGAHAQLVGLQQTRDDRVQFASPKMDPESVTRRSLYSVEIDIEFIKFVEHFLFLQEHRLSLALEDLYRTYRTRVGQGTSTLLGHRLTALKEAKASLQKRLQETGMQNPGGLSHADEISQRLRPRLAEYQQDILDTRLSRDAEMAVDLGIIRDIVTTWKELKRVRQQGVQGFTSTPHQLRVYTEATDEADDMHTLERDVDDEVQERKDLFHLKQERMQRAYRERLAQEIYRMENDPSVDAEEVAKLDSESMPASLMVPFDGAAVRDEVVQRLRGCRRPPGAPVLIPTLSMESPVHADDEVPHSEFQRRERVRRFRYTITTILNGRPVHRSEPVELTDDFTIPAKLSYQLHLREAPRDVSLELVEVGSGGIFSPPVSIRVPIPVGAEGVKTECDGRTTKFAYEKRTRAGETGVGNADAHTVRGHIECAIRWESGDGVSPDQKSNTNGAVGLDAVEALGAHGVRDFKKLQEWAASSKVDPNDPRNAHLVARLKQTGKDEDGSYFRLRCDEVGDLRSQPDADPLPGEVEPSKREKMIRLRTEEAIGYRDLVVPLREDEIKDSTFDKVEATRRADLLLLAGNDNEDDEPHFRHTEHAEFLRAIRDAQLKKQRKILHVPQLAEVVDETRLLPHESGGLVAWIKDHFGGGGGPRPLKPSRKVRKVVGHVTEDFAVAEPRTLRITVSRATNLPCRTRPGAMNQTLGRDDTLGRSQMIPIGADSTLTQQTATRIPPDSSTSELVDAVDLQPFVEVVFQGHSGVTPVGTGRDPVWNFPFEMAFVPPGNSFTQESLQSCDDAIVFHVYDQRYVDVLEDEGQREDVIHMRRQRRWLGSMSIPVRTIYSQIDPNSKCKVDGTFKIDVPFALVGYTRSPLRRQRSDSYLSVLLTLTPSLPSPESSVVVRDTVEEPRVMAYAKHWKDSLMVHHPHNYVMPTAQDIHGTTVLICRYIHRQLPPHAVCDPTSVRPDTVYEAMRRLARFVSTIPEKQDSSIFVGFCNLWATSSQFLQMMGGDDEEHAILLCNYFLSLPGFVPSADGSKPENEAYVVLGRGIPRGNSIFVLTYHRVASDSSGDGPAREANGLQTDKDGFARLFWDPMTGLAYPVQDTRCPLQNVDCIFNEHNIWANIQKANNNPREKSVAKASTTKYDVTKGGWKPFFTKQFPRPELTSYQIEQLVYRPTPPEHTALLRTELQRRVRDAFISWRPRNFTAWSRSCQKRLEEILPLFEEAWIDSECGRNEKKSEVEESLREVSSLYSLVGLPLNFPFTTYSDVLARVYNTNIHTIAEDNVEFSIAVHVHPYPNDFFSIWMYIGTSEPQLGGQQQLTSTLRAGSSLSYRGSSPGGNRGTWRTGRQASM